MESSVRCDCEARVNDEMKLFAIHYDSSEDFIEAETMREAIRVWHLHMKLQNGSDWFGDEEPEACRLVSEKPVLRTIEAQTAEARTHTKG